MIRTPKVPFEEVSTAQEVCRSFLQRRRAGKPIPQPLLANCNSSVESFYKEINGATPGQIKSIIKKHRDNFLRLLGDYGHPSEDADMVVEIAEAPLYDLGVISDPKPQLTLNDRMAQIEKALKLV